MQDVNNHMDNLLRKAAADYPLKTDTGDWDGLQARLLMPHGTTAVTPARNKFNKYVLPLLLVLMMLLLGGDYSPVPAKKEANTGNGTVLTNPETITGKQSQQQKPFKNKAAISMVPDLAPAKE